MPRPFAEVRLGAAGTVPALLAGALALGLAVQVLLPTAPAPPIGTLSTPRSLARSVQTVGHDAPVVSYASILARPLFSPTRTSAPVEIGAPTGSFALLGLAMAGSRATATFSDAGGGVRTLSLGETVEGWRLEAVGRGQAVLRRGAEVQTLRVGAPPAHPTPPAEALPAARPTGSDS